MKLTRYLFLAFAALLIASMFSQMTIAQQSAPEYVPNDPKADLTHARAINLLRAYAKILQIEQTTGPKMPQAVMAILDEWVDCSHVEFAATCLPQYTFNATDRPFKNNELHGMSAAGTGAAATDNNMGVSSPNFLSRIKFIPIKICEGNLCKSEWVQAGLQRVLQLKRSGVPIVVIGLNFIGGVADAVAIDRLLKDLDAEQIDIIAPDGDAGPSHNYDLGVAFPLTYSRTYDNIIAVSAGDQTGERLSPGSSFGPKTFILTAPGINVRTISLLNPANGSGSMSGSSSVTHQIAAIYALVRVYREPDSAKARWLLKYTARMYPDLEGRLRATPGATDDAGRMAGKVDVYDALTMEVGCPPISTAPMWVTKRDSNRAIVADSVSLVTGPFSVVNQGNYFAADKRTRIVAFAYNVPLGATVQVQAKDSLNQVVSLPVESLSALSVPLGCITQLNIKLTPASPQPQLAVGDVTLTLSVNGETSQAVIKVKS